MNTPHHKIFLEPSGEGFAFQSAKYRKEDLNGQHNIQTVKGLFITTVLDKEWKAERAVGVGTLSAIK